MPRLHGLTPFTGTSLDRVLRNMGIDTVVAIGNSVNIGVHGPRASPRSTSATRS